MTEAVFYDDALPRYAAIVIKHLGKEAVRDHFFLRDASGRLTLILTKDVSPLQREAIAADAYKTLKPYVEHESYAVMNQAELFDEHVVTAEASMESVQHEAYTGDLRLIERRIVGQDWLTPPQQKRDGAPPIVVFASLKGGVGRSTALAVAAADCASDGYNILIIDLDLESPGIGAMLLPDDRRPEFGCVDYFVENGLQPIEDKFLEDMIGVSPLTQGRGLVHVVPATGRRSEQYPQNFIGKLSRAYLDDSDDNKPRTFLDQTRTLVDTLTARRSYDAVFVDARAGLNETTAAAILGLGADTLLFGVDMPQTFEGYRYLLAYMQRFIRSDDTEENDWRWRLRMVHAKASANRRALTLFRDRAYDLFSESLYEKDDASEDTEARFAFNLDDINAPHYAWPILNDANYIEFDPVSEPTQLTHERFAPTFGDFLKPLRDLLGLGRK